MKRTRLVSMALAMAAMAFAALLAAAQEAPDVRLTDAKVGARWNKEAFDRLLGRMAELGLLLEKSDPDAARALREAVKVAQSADVSGDMSKVLDLLDKAMPAKAAGKEAEIIQDLQAVLEALRRSRVTDPNDRLRTLEGFRDRVRRLKVEEANLVRENATTRPTDPVGELARQIGALAAAQRNLMGPTADAAADPYVLMLIRLRNEVRGLHAEQGTLIVSAAAMPIDKLPVAGAVQDKLAAKADRTAGKVAAAAKDAGLGKAILAARADPNDVERAGSYTSDAAEEMRKAGKALAGSSSAGAERPQSAASGDLEKADEVLTALIDKMTAGTPSGTLAGPQTELQNTARALAAAARELAGATTQPAGATTQPGGPPPQGNLGAAADAMADAARRLGSQDPNGALADQERAVRHLEGFRKYELAQLHPRPDDQPRSPQEQARDQKKLEGETGDLERDMENASGKDPAGRPTPGQGKVKSAEGGMGRASDKMTQGRLGDARPDQEQARSDLQDAEDEIEREIDEFKRGQQERRLASILESLAKILDAQKGISKETRTSQEKLLAARDGDRAEKRTVELTLTSRLAPGEANLAGGVQEVLDLLVGEGATDVFPFVLGVVKKDLLDVRDRLGRKDAGTLTQTIQTEIEKNLQEMIGAIRDHLADRNEKRRKTPPPPPPPPPDPNRPPPPPPPLLPALAELKMLRAMQLQINGRTVILDRQASEKALSADQHEQQSRELSQRESDVRKLTDATAARIAQPRPRGAPAP